MIDDKNICILLKCITTEIGKKKNALFSKYGITGFQSDILAFLYRNIKPTIKALEIGENIRRELDNFYDFKEVLSKEEIKKLEYLLKKMYDYTLKII